MLAIPLANEVPGFLARDFMKRKQTLLLILAGGVLLFLFAQFFPQFIQPENKPNSTLEIHFLNVGQGDSILLKNKNYTMLVDCGAPEVGKNISAYLLFGDIRRIDYLVITHTDSDHIGGCAEILRNFYVKNVIMDGQKRDTSAYRNVLMLIDNENLIIPKKYERFELGEAYLQVLHANTNSSLPNQNSVVLFVDFGNFELLLDADCDGECEKDLLNENIDADVLKVAHHGSKYASSLEFLKKVSPELAIISVGKNNYGHPTQETIAGLNAVAQILRTDLNGTIVLKTNGENYSLSVEN